jgi:SAM-dependent methyltransferase
MTSPLDAAAASAAAQQQQRQTIEDLQEQLRQAQLQVGKGDIGGSSSSKKKNRALDAQICRDTVFRSRGQGGGNGESTHDRVRAACTNTPHLYNVCRDLQDYTGLADAEFYDRLARIGRFHFEAEHAYWNPASATELAWYYATSLNYLFANALHRVWAQKVDRVAHARYEPILDYSGGVGNNVLHLARTEGLRCRYFGIGTMEYQFARYRAARHKLEHLIDFVPPRSAATGYRFDPIRAALPRDQSLGAIIAMDVLEHIPDYHVVVEAMVDSIRVGGAIVEVTPFAKEAPMPAAAGTTTTDTRVHLSDGGIDRATAMGPRMRFDHGLWVKISE